MYNDDYNTNSIPKSPRAPAPGYQHMQPPQCNCVKLKSCKIFMDQMKPSNSYFQNQYINAQIQFSSCNYFEIEKYVCCPNTSAPPTNIERRNTYDHGKKGHGSWSWPGYDDGQDSAEESGEHSGGSYHSQNQFFYPQLFNNFQKNFKNMFHSPFLSQHEGKFKIIFFN